jgi:hypothetical protein
MTISNRSEPVRIAVVADIHHGQDRLTKKGGRALPLLEEFVRFVEQTRPDAVVDLGDRISDRDRDADLARQREVAAVFAAVAVPRLHLCGNHDRAHLDVAENEAALGVPLGNRTLDLGGWRVVMWAADTQGRPAHGFTLGETDLAWLAHTVETADRPLAVMSHIPLSGHSQVGNYYFENNPHLATYPEAGQVRAMLRGARVPVVCVAGHVHWNTLTVVDGIPHLTLQSLTESFTTAPEPAGSFALLELGASIGWTVHGRDPFALKLDAAATTRRWMPPLPPFGQAPLPDAAAAG